MFTVIKSDLTEHGPFPTLTSAQVWAERNSWLGYSVQRVSDLPLIEVREISVAQLIRSLNSLEASHA